MSKPEALTYLSLHLFSLIESLSKFEYRFDIETETVGAKQLQPTSPSRMDLACTYGCLAGGVVDVRSGGLVSTSKLRRLRHGFSDRGHPLKAKRCSRVSPQALLPLRSKPRVRRKRAARPGPGGTWGHGMSTSQKTVQRGCILWAVSTSKLRCKSEKEVWFFNCGAYPALFPFRRRTDS